MNIEQGEWNKTKQKEGKQKILFGPQIKCAFEYYKSVSQKIIFNVLLWDCKTVHLFHPWCRGNSWCQGS